MNETVKKCLHCGEPMQTGRSTKKYCSDSCKQAAFYNRAAQQVITLNDNEPFNDNDEENEANIEDGREAAEEYSRHVPEQPFNVTANRSDDEKPATKQSYSIPAMRKKPAPVHEEYEEDQQALPFNSKSISKMQAPEKPFNVKQKAATVTKPKLKLDEDEEPYEWLRSELVDEIGDYVNDNYTVTEMFQYPKKYWYSSDLEKVKWVSIRFRCIIENLLRFDRAEVERKTLITMSKALKAMIEAWNFKYVPYNYPLKNEVINLQKSIEALSKSANKTIRLYITREKKVKLVALRFQLADLVPFVKFSQLDFSK